MNALDGGDSEQRVRRPTFASIAERARMLIMTTTTEKAAAAFELLPEEMREPAVQYLLEQAEKFRALKELVAKGMDDATSGRVSEWNFRDFLREARTLRPK
jgi:hypothetical protein